VTLSTFLVLSVPAHAGEVSDPESGGGLPLSWIDTAPVLRRTDRGTAVAEWQVQLNRWLAHRSTDDGFRLEVDGDFGPLTDAVTRSLQHVEGLPVDGIVGPVTRAAYLSAGALATDADDPAQDLVVARPGSMGPNVAAWQRSLNRWRAAAGASGPDLAVDGVFGPNTEAATRAFQASQSITVDGLIGPETLAAFRSAAALVNGPVSTPPPEGMDPPPIIGYGVPRPPEADAPAAGVCGEQSTPIVTVKIDDELGDPRCLVVHRNQRLRIENVASHDVTFFVAEFQTFLPAGQTSFDDRPIGEYLGDGVHTIHVARFDGAGPQLWVRP
jgi:peptidoglycan hydrolase-like protein with peptidoglycan-binding domain